MTKPTNSSPRAAMRLSPIARRCLVTFLIAASLTLPVRAQTSVPSGHRIELIYAFDGTQPRFSFSVDAKRFDSVEGMKAYLARLPRGSVVAWSPGCKRLGGEPLLSSKRDMDEFRAFLEARGLRFDLIPSG